MLGKAIIDSGVESHAGVYPGLGLLDIATRFDRYEKKTEQVTLRARPVGPILSAMGTVSGYEIHMGITSNESEEEAFEGEGATSSTGLVFGTYLHGLFTNPSAVDALCSYLYNKKGLSYAGWKDTVDPYENLANTFLQHVKLDLILSCFR
jgi:adenosylcobyric acid synthase